MNLLTSRDCRLHILLKQEDNLLFAMQIDTFSRTRFITRKENVALITVSLFTHFASIFVRIPLRKNLLRYTYLVGGKYSLLSPSKALFHLFNNLVGLSEFLNVNGIS